VDKLPLDNYLSLFTTEIHVLIQNSLNTKELMNLGHINNGKKLTFPIASLPLFSKVMFITSMAMKTAN
jgi:hypothetical protein